MGEGKVGTLREINVLGFVRILLEFVSGPNGLCKLSLDFWVGLGLGMTL